MDSGGVNANQIGTNVWATAARTLTAQKLQALTSVSVSLTAIATTSILTYSATGGSVLDIGVVTTTAISGAGLTSFLDIIIDGQTFTLALYTGTGYDNQWRAMTTAGIIVGAPPGSANGDGAGLAVYLPFNTSVTIQVRVTGAAATTGACSVLVMWVHP